jgi:hypothetical protein
MQYTIEKYVDGVSCGVISANNDKEDTERYLGYLKDQYAEILKGKFADTVDKGITLQMGSAKDTASIQWAKSGAFTAGK